MFRAILRALHGTRIVTYAVFPRVHPNSPPPPPSPDSFILRQNYYPRRAYNRP